METTLGLILLLIAARSTGSSCNPKTGAWQELSWLKAEGIVALAFDPRKNLLYGLQGMGLSKVAAKLVKRD